jgi:septum formation protein
MSQPNLMDDPPSYEAASPNSNAKSAQITSNSTTSATVPPRRLRPPPPLDLPALSLVRNKRIILASQSPRRKQLLAQIGLTNIEIIPSKFEENLPKTASPFEYVLATATAKAMAVYRQEADDPKKAEPGLIIAADTVVVHANGDILEKPRSEVDHITMLKSLRDSGFHRVYTAVALMAPLASARDPGYALETATEETLVKFDRDITDELLLAYVRTREGADKAGGYGIQGTGAILVEKIEGSFDNVVGLPLRATLKLIEQIVEKADDEDTLEGEAEMLGTGGADVDDD